MPEWRLLERTAPGPTGFGLFPYVPGFARFFPGSGGKIPGSALTGNARKLLNGNADFTRFWAGK
jgi:hypothetical protein